MVKKKTDAPTPADWKSMLVWAVVNHLWKILAFVSVVVLSVIALNLSCRVSRDREGKLRLEQINVKPAKVKIGDTEIHATAEGKKR
ncbi:MAG TPA: hypothetical protein PKM65_20405 [Spirochaetota bacterium]|nr:hypothetical protein [Spirochaetota bacterium]